jgi:hypothetical protein
MKELDEFCSDVVDVVYDIFCLGKSLLNQEDFSKIYPKMPKLASEKILNFHQKHRYQQCHTELKEFFGDLPKPVFEHLEELTEQCIDLGEQRRDELELFRDSARRIHGKIENLKLKPNAEEELQLQQQYLEMHEEHGKVKFPQLSELEQELKDVVHQLQNLTDTIAPILNSLNVDISSGLELAHMILNEEFSLIQEKHWDSFAENLSQEEKKLLKDFYSFKSKKGFYELELHVHYVSPITGEQIIGSKTSQVGLPAQNPLVKKITDKKMKPFYFLDTAKESLSFYRFVCKEALKDGILTAQEIKQMLTIARELDIDSKDAAMVMNEVALAVQQDLIYSALSAMFEMANAADGIQKDEQIHILNLKNVYQEKVVKDLGERFLQNPNANLELCVTEEGIFVELLKISFKGNDFGQSELAILKKYAKSMDWKEEQLKKVIEKTKLELANNQVK